jgi:hypothetical protein
MYLNPLRLKSTRGSRNEFKINLLKRQILPIKIKTLAKSGNTNLSKKKFRHQDTKTRSLIIININCLCLGTFVAIFSGVSRLGITKGESGRSCIPVSEPHRIAGECGYHIF